MNRAEFIQDLKDRGVYERVGEVRPALGDKDHAERIAELGASLYLVPVTEKIQDVDGNDVTKTGHITITVFDPDTEQELVQWEGKVEPGFQKRPDDTAFVDALRAWYVANKPESVVKFQIVETDRENKFAILRVFDVVDGVATEGQKFIYRVGATTKVADLA